MRPFLYKALMLGGFSAVLGFAAGWVLRLEPTRLTFLAVGQGDCAVFQHAGSTVLIDAGPKAHGVDAGDRIVVPRLARLGVRGLDLIILTHPDDDHMGGADSLLRAYPSARIAISEHFKVHDAVREKVASWGERRVVWLQAGSEMKLGEFQFTFHAPKPAKDDNSGSLVIHLSNGASTAVFTGDLDSDAEQSVALLGNWDADVMTAGHHGSRTSTSDAWLKEVTPEIVVVSCGRDNAYNHPASETLDRIERHKAELHRTDLHGDLRLVPFGEGWARE